MNLARSQSGIGAVLRCWTGASATRLAAALVATLLQACAGERTVAYTRDAVLDFDEETGAFGPPRDSGISGLQLISPQLVGRRFLLARGPTSIVRSLQVKPGTGELTVQATYTHARGRVYLTDSVLVGGTYAARTGLRGGSGLNALETLVIDPVTGAISAGTFRQDPSEVYRLRAHVGKRWLFALDGGVSRPPLVTFRAGEFGALRYTDSLPLGDRWSTMAQSPQLGLTDPGGQTFYHLGRRLVEEVGFDEGSGRLTRYSTLDVPAELGEFDYDAGAVDPRGEFIALLTRRFVARLPAVHEVHLIRLDRSGGGLALRHVAVFTTARSPAARLRWAPLGHYLFARDLVLRRDASGRFTVAGTDTTEFEFVRIPESG